ncbi:MAG: DUF167 domain-containing protein [Candidatus Binatia bacterium]
MPLPWHSTPQGIVLRVHVQPRSSQNRLSGIHGESLKIALTAPPVDGAANSALIHFLAALLDLSPSSIFLQAGRSARQKRVLICTATPEVITQRLHTVLTRVDKKRRDG